MSSYPHNAIAYISSCDVIKKKSGKNCVTKCARCYHQATAEEPSATLYISAMLNMISGTLSHRQLHKQGKGTHHNTGEIYRKNKCSFTTVHETHFVITMNMYLKNLTQPELSTNTYCIIYFPKEPAIDTNKVYKKQFTQNSPLSYIHKLYLMQSTQAHRTTQKCSRIIHANTPTQA